MRKLSYFREVHPNWSTVESMGPMEAAATVDVLMTGLLVDEMLSDDELDTMHEEWERFPFVEAHSEDISFNGALDEANQRHNTFRESPEQLGDFLEESSEKLSGEEVRLAVLRLVTISLSVDGLTETEIDYAYALGHHLKLEPDTTEGIIRSVWETHETSERRAKGEDVHIPPVYGYERAKSRSGQTYPNPFTSRLH